MRRTRQAALLPIALAAVLAFSVACAVPGAASDGGAGTRVSPARAAKCPWLNSALPASKRISLLLARMTLADKLKLVQGEGTGRRYVFNTAAQPSLCIPAMGEEDGPSGVGDGMTGVTQLPAGVSLAAAFDPALARKYGAVIGREQRGKGVAVDLGPTVNIDRDPRWGRSFESYSEDPYLTSRLAVAEITGVQSRGEMAQVKHYAVYDQETARNTLADNAIVSERAEHEIYLPPFHQAVTKAKVASVMCAYSVVNGDYACQDPELELTTLRQRWGFDGFVTSDYGALHSVRGAADGTDMEQPFHDYYGAALRKAIAGGSISVSVLNDMVTRILREMVRFRLFTDPPAGKPADRVTSAAHQAVSEQVAQAGTVLLRNRGALPLHASGAGTVAVIGPAAAASATYSGGGSSYVRPPFTVTPLAGLRAGARSGTRVTYHQGLPADTSLPAVPKRDLSPGYHPTPAGGSYAGTLTAPATGTYVLALRNTCGCYHPATLAVNGKVILSNAGSHPVTTMSASVRLVRGHHYRLAVAGSSAGLTWATPSVLRPRIAAAAAAARQARTAVVVVSDDTESEGADRPSLNLPSAQNQLISAVARASRRTVVVIDAGAPVTMPWLSHVAAVVDAWYPGESNGTALARVLYGGADPSGHLPVTFPKELSQVPAHTAAEFPGEDGRVDYSENLEVGYRWYDARHKTPLFPFGYGLSYTRFRFSQLHVSTAAGPRVTVTARVTDTGKRAGAEVAQLYLADPASAGEPPRQLEGFQRVSLRPGRSATVRFTLDQHALSTWSDSADKWVVATGKFGVRVGDSSALSGLPLSGSFTIAG